MVHITASYSTGSVTGTDVEMLMLEGSWGIILDGTITASYSTGSVDGANGVGGLVGNNFGGTITASYYPDTITIMGGDNTDGEQTASAMQTPVGYTGLYVNWNVDIDGDSAGDDPWDFGSSSDYPTLKVDFNGDGVTSKRRRVWIAVEAPSSPPSAEGIVDHRIWPLEK